MIMMLGLLLVAACGAVGAGLVLAWALEDSNGKPKVILDIEQTRSVVIARTILLIAIILVIMVVAALGIT